MEEGWQGNAQAMLGPVFKGSAAYLELYFMFAVETRVRDLFSFAAAPLLGSDLLLLLPFLWLLLELMKPFYCRL